jgi:hypothetical protein
MTYKKEDHPGMLLMNNMHTASRMRDAITEMLRRKKVTRLNDFSLVVDFAMKPDEFTYEYNLRVYRKDKKGPPVLSFWAPTRDALVSDVNVVKLLILYNVSPL